jgi:hypothetical protein
MRKKRNPFNVITRFLPKWEEKTIVDYVKDGQFVGTNRRPRNWPTGWDPNSYQLNKKEAVLTNSFAMKIGIAGTIACLAILNTSPKGLMGQLAGGFLLPSAGAAWLGFSQGTQYTSAGILMVYASRRRRGQKAAKENFDGVVTNDGLLIGTNLLPAMKKYLSTKTLFERMYNTSDLVESGVDPATTSFVEDGKAFIKDLIARVLDDKAILEADYQKSLDGVQDNLIPKLVLVLKNATVLIDVIGKLEETRADELGGEVLLKKDDLQRFRFNLIKNHPGTVQFLNSEGHYLNVSPNAEIDEVNKSFAELDLSEVVYLPSDTSIDAITSQENPWFAATTSEDGSTAESIDLTPAQKQRLEELAQELDRR